MTTTATHPTVTCPTWCRRVHNESPLETLIHESERTNIYSLPEPNGLTRPSVRVCLAQVEDETTVVLVGEHVLTPVDAEDLMAALRTALNQAYATLAELAGDGR